MPVIGIRVDVNEIVATGHIMRCIAIAKEIKKHGGTVLFFLADEFGISFLNDNGFPYVILGSDWEQPLGEVDFLAKQLQEKRIEEVLFDSYRFTKTYFKALKARTDGKIKFSYVDDLFEDIYPVDRIINYNAYYTEFPYREKYGSEVELLLGPGYAPLREEFADGTELYEKKIKNPEKFFILLSCGGGDRLHVMKEVLQKYQKILAEKDRKIDWSAVVWQVVAGRLSDDREELLQMGRDNKNIQIHSDVKEMAKLMAECDVAVSAAGTMLYELCAMQIPTVCFITADNQRYDGMYFAQDDRMLNAGDIRKDRNRCIENIFTGIERILTNPLLYDKMKRKLSAMTDGKGAERIALKLLHRN